MRPFGCFPKLRIGREVNEATSLIMLQVLDSCLEVATANSDSGKNAKACTADIKAANSKMLKLGHRVSSAFPSAWTRVPF